MDISQLPFYPLFDALRSDDFPLGIDEYLALVQALEGGFGLLDADELAQVCCVLWAKSTDEQLILRKRFGEVLQPYFALAAIEDDTPTPTHDSNLPPDKPDPALPQDDALKQPEPAAHPQKQNAPAPLPDPVARMALARRAGLGRRGDQSRYRVLSDYFPVTTRQMKQSWRYLRQSVREGPPEELDVDATIDKMGRQGLLSAPVLLPRRVNRAELIVLVDRDGSMVPFHGLLRQLTETAQRGGKLKQAATYYFHDWPDGYVYGDPARTDEIDILTLLSGGTKEVAISTRTAVLIVSDAGAARGTLDEDRIAGTSAFVHNVLKPHIRRYAWLNPMPKPRWQGSSASRISQMLPMFEMNREGLLDAIGVLRGRAQPQPGGV